MVSYDTNVIIYALESDNKYSKPARQIITEAESGGAVLSVLVMHEIYTGRVLKGEDIGFAKKALDSLTGVKWLNVDKDIVTLASQLTKMYGSKIRGYDAIVVATAITGGADKFITNDKELANLGLKEISILPLV